MKASQWIDRLQAERGWGSDYKVAKEVGIVPSTISRYRNKPESTMDDETAIRVAEALGERPAVVLLDQAAERAKSDRARQELMSVVEQLQGKKPEPALRVAAGGGKGRIDISLSASIMAGGDPAHSMSIRCADECDEDELNTHRIDWDLDEIERQREAAEQSLLAQFAAMRAGGHSPRFSRA